MVNAADNKQRDDKMDRINVTVNQEEGSISVWNNGNGIPVVKHSEHGVYVPELIFGHLLTGSNFDDDEKKTTGGRNGYVCACSVITSFSLSPPPFNFPTIYLHPFFCMEGLVSHLFLLSDSHPLEFLFLLVHLFFFFNI
jgi:hypothetical protein